MLGAAADDIVQPFQVDPFRLRGRLVRLGPVIDEILTRHAYPAAVAAMLGEAIAIAVTMAGALRGYAQFDRARLDELGAAAELSVPRLLGAGYLALTVDQGEHTERYQGIVALEGGSLAECVHHYFRQSEQVEAGLKVAVARHRNGDGHAHWRAGALMIERLPKENDTRSREDEDEGWRRAMILMSTSTTQELLDSSLPPEDLLFRLFHEDGVRAYRPHDLAAR